MIVNEAKIKGGIIDLNRSHVEQRAAVYSYMYNSQKDVDESIKSCKVVTSQLGLYNAGNLKLNLKNPEDLQEFVNSYFNGIILKTYEIEIVDSKETQVVLEFQYCPLVNMWQKMNLEETTIADLCDIAMEADRAAASEMGFELEITDTIAKGCKSCKMKFFNPKHPQTKEI